MKAIRVHEFGGPDVLKYEEAPVPEPGPGQALVKIEAAGLNFIDTYHRTGAYAVELPITPGVEGAGVVEAVGSEVEGVKPGDHVTYCMRIGAYAEYAAVDAEMLVPIPDGVSSREAVAVMVQGLTAHYLSHSTFPLEPGHTALIHAAAGGLGQMLVRLAALRGAKIIGTVSTVEKAAVARAAGAEKVILYTEEDFEEETLRMTGGNGVDVVYDSVGKTTWEKSLNCLRPRGMFVLCGQSSGAVPPVDLQILNRKGSLFATRPTLGNYISDRDELLSRAEDVFGWIRDGDLKVYIDETYPLSEASEAHRYLEARKTKGKVLLLP